MSTLWFYAENGESRGPATEEELRRRFLKSELPMGTLVWSEGMAAWAPAERVAALTQTPPPLPAPAAAPAAASAVALPSGSARALSAEQTRRALMLHRPWARFGARVLDVLLFQVVVMLFVPAAWVPDEENMLQVNLFLIGSSIVTLIAWTFVEAFLLSRWGMTPGKWVYRLKIVHPDGRLLRYSEALRRGFHVLFGGMALGLPGVPLITMAMAYKELIETGATSWDRRGHLAILHGTQKPLHQFIALLCAGLLIWLSVRTLIAFSG